MLLIAAVFVAMFCFMPFATVAPAENVEATKLFAKDAPAFLVLNIVIAVLLVIVIFMYKDLRRQMRMTILSILLICASVVTCAFIMFGAYDNATPILFGGVVLLVLAMLFALLAYRGMSRDRNLLRSMDRLR